MPWSPTPNWSHRDVEVHWKAAPRTAISRTDRLVPYVAGALPLVVARSRIDDTDDAGVTLGAGHPAVCVAWIPSCGCDACDGGAQPEIDQLDDVIPERSSREGRSSAGRTAGDSIRPEQGQSQQHHPVRTRRCGHVLSVWSDVPGRQGPMLVAWARGASEPWRSVITPCVAGGLAGEKNRDSIPDG